MQLIVREDETRFDEEDEMREEVGPEGPWRKSDLGQDGETESDAVSCLERLLNGVADEEVSSSEDSSSSSAEDSDSDATITNEADLKGGDYSEGSEGEYNEWDDDFAEEGPCFEWTIGTIEEENEDEAEAEPEAYNANGHWLSIDPNSPESLQAALHTKASQALAFQATASEFLHEPKASESLVLQAKDVQSEPLEVLKLQAEAPDPLTLQAKASWFPALQLADPTLIKASEFPECLVLQAARASVLPELQSTGFEHGDFSGSPALQSIALQAVTASNLPASQPKESVNAKFSEVPALVKKASESLAIQQEKAAELVAVEARGSEAGAIQGKAGVWLALEGEAWEGTLEAGGRVETNASGKHEQTESRVSTHQPNSHSEFGEEKSGTKAYLSTPPNFGSAQHETQQALTPQSTGQVSPSPAAPPLKSPQAPEQEMHQTQRDPSTDTRHLRSLLKKPGHAKQRKGRCVTFNESLNLFYDAECSCWVHEDDYGRYRQEEYEYERAREEMYTYEPPPIPVEFEDPPTLSPPEGYKDRFFPQDLHIHHPINPDPDVTRVSPPSPPAAKRKVFLKENQPTVNGQPEHEPEEETKEKKKGLRLGGILKGGRLWRSNSSDGKKVISPPDEPDLVKCAEPSPSQSVQTTQYSTYDYAHHPAYQQQQQQPPSNLPQAPPPAKVSIGTAPLRTSEQIRLAVDSTLRGRSSRLAKKPECSTLVEKLRWLTSLDDEESSDSGQSGFATWPSRDKNGVLIPPGSAKKSDAGTSTSDQETFVDSANLVRSNMVHEARIKQIAYTLEDIEEGLNGNEIELESFVSGDGGRIERIRKRYGEEGGDDYGFSRRPSVKGIRPKFSSTNQIFATFTSRRSAESPISTGNTNGGQLISHTAEFPVPARMNILSLESQYENTRLPQMQMQQPQSQPNENSSQRLENSSAPQQQQPPADTARALNYEFQNAPGRQTEESRAHFEMIRQSFESATAGSGTNFINSTYSRPHSWSVSTLPNPHHHHGQQQSQLSQNGVNGPGTPQQPIYGTVRRVPNVIGRPLFLHYGALSVEAHPNRIPCPPVGGPGPKVAETPSPTQQPPTLPAQPPGTRYYGPPIRYYNQPPPIPPRTVTANNMSGSVVIPAPLPVGINNLNMPPHSGGSGTHSHPHVNVLMSMNGVERGVPEGATDEEPNHKEPYSMNV